ncbi:hypothetical protein CLOM_g5549 [Closterium sp. NIES-68]|nr:hypothetical protein CLOM_g5549 [Closterium sp. NIES-68]
MARSSRWLLLSVFLTACIALCCLRAVAADSPPASSPSANSTSANSTSAASTAPAPSASGEGEAKGEEGGVDPALFQVHGWLMWLSYGLLMPVGLITARHLQTVTPKWFAIHWGIQLLAVMLAFIGFFIAVGKFGKEAATESLHARMGIAVFTFTLAQPLLGLLRPHKGNKVRVAWYFLHWLLGILAVGLGWYVLFLGLELYEHETDQNVKSYEIALGVGTSLLLFAFLLLGRWDHLVGQADSASKVDGLTRFPSVAHVSSLLHLGGGKASEERIAAERGLAEERAAALGGP